MTPTTDQLYRYANRWAAGFRNRAIEHDKAGNFPAVRRCAARFGCAQSVIESVADEGDTTGDGYMSLASYNVHPPQPLGDHVVEAYGRTTDDVDLEGMVPYPEPEVGP